MGTGRMVRAVGLALALSLPADAATAAGDPAWPDAEALAATLHAPEAPLVPPPPVERAVNEVGGKYLATPFRPVALGEPDSIVDRILAEAIERGHWRAGSRQVEHPDQEWLAEAEVDALWDDLTAMSTDDRFRRLRPIADFLRETSPGEFTLTEEQEAAEPAAVATRDGWLVRMVKNVMSASDRGRLITRERVIIALFAVAALSGLLRLAVRS